MLKYVNEVVFMLFIFKKDVYDPYEEFNSSFQGFDLSLRWFDSSFKSSESSSQASTVNSLHTILLLDDK